MTKSQALVLQLDSHKKKKLKLNVEEITCVQDERKEEMNGKKKKKKRKADDEGLETSTQLNGDHEENIRKKKKKKSEVCVPVENITEEPQDTEPMEETHKQEDHMKKKKKKKKQKVMRNTLLLYFMFVKVLGAVDERVQAAVGAGRQGHHVSRQRVALPQRVVSSPPRGVSVATQEMHADEDVLRKPAHKKHAHGCDDHAQGFGSLRPIGAQKHACDQGVANAHHAKRQGESQRHLQPLHLGHARKTEATPPAVTHVRCSEWDQRAQGGRRPNGRASPTGDARTEERHAGAQHGVVVVVRAQVEHLDERVQHQHQVGQSQISEVEVRGAHPLTRVKVHQQNQDVTHEAEREEQDGVDAGEEKVYGVGGVRFVDVNNRPVQAGVIRNVDFKRHMIFQSSGDVNTSVQQEPSGVEDENGLDGEEELSPEERRVLERKLKKILNKEEKRKLKEEGKSIKPEKVKTNVAETQALEYLACWSKNREAWKFNKSRQTWLLQNMYDSVKVSDDHFEMLLPYIDGLQGLARSSTLQKAEAIVRWEGQAEEADTADAEKRQGRAKQVVQML
ncbi:uncharacterized protein C7orf50 homolog [Rhinichthys klamathensis goyatoka]|uniref:uncharacterized protein C7orf50 homolog n=1 Tax=Rhinichthys klamathensis goyatoka TaxID=3034132 RepID=UPI0024B4F15F|nr:uncharacterized protein C7orf50 homolog [Rhinichthys klamathensis goyatoka]